MKGFVAVAVLAAATVAPSGAAVRLPAGTYPLATDSGGVVRTAWLHIPPIPEPEAGYPLVLVFHGTLGTGRNIEAKTGFDAVADEAGFLVAYPNAFGIQWRDGREDSAGNPPADDVRYTRDLIDQIARLMPVDQTRVYATGLSSGGFLSNRLGLELSDRIAAIAPVAGVLDESLTGAPPHPVSVAAFHGTADTTIRYDGRDGTQQEGVAQSLLVGGPHPGAEASIGRWAAMNGCGDGTQTTMLPDKDPGDGTRVERVDYTQCPAGVEVVLYRIVGGAHAWAGGTGDGQSLSRGETETRDIFGAEVMWEFFSRHQR